MTLFVETAKVSRRDGEMRSSYVLRDKPPTKSSKKGGQKVQDLLSCYF